MMSYFYYYNDKYWRFLFSFGQQEEDEKYARIGMQASARASILKKEKDESDEKEMWRSVSYLSHVYLSGRSKRLLMKREEI